jgi:glycerol-3-phosphate dehydrogenase
LTDESSPVLAAELIYAVRHEFACTLADVVLRRTALAQSGRPSRDSLVAAAAVVAPHLGWTAAEQAAQVAAVESAFPSTAG